MEKQILRAVEEAYRKGLQDAKGLNDISSFLLTSQIVAHDVANKFCQPLVSGQLPTPQDIQWKARQLTNTAFNEWWEKVFKISHNGSAAWRGAGLST